MKRVGLNLAIAGLVATAASVPAAAQEEKSPIGPTAKFSNNIEVCVLHPDFEGVCLPQNITQIEGGGSRVRLVNRGTLPLYVALLRTNAQTVLAQVLTGEQTIVRLAPGESVTTDPLNVPEDTTWDMAVLAAAEPFDTGPRSTTVLPPDWREARFWLGNNSEPEPAAGGGFAVAFGEADWMVAIYDPRPFGRAEIAADNALPANQRRFLAEKTPEERAHSCGGAMIADNVVITAAHCVAAGAFLGANTSKVFKERRVRLGTLRLGKGGETRAIVGLAVHADYNGAATGQPNDIALLLLKRDDQVHYRPRPLKIGTSAIGAKEEMMVLGWGYTKETRGGLINMMQDGGAQRNAVALQQAPMQAVTTPECAKHLGQNKLKPRMICMGTPEERRERGGPPTFSCRGDSGGPLVRNFGGGAEELVGLVSWSVGCGNGKPSVFTNVTGFARWIAAARPLLKAGAAITVPEPPRPQRGPRRP